MNEAYTTIDIAQLVEGLLNAQEGWTTNDAKEESMNDFLTENFPDCGFGIEWSTRHKEWQTYLA